VIKGNEIVENNMLYNCGNRTYLSLIWYWAGVALIVEDFEKNLYLHLQISAARSCIQVYMVRASTA
jgi:hypothetical protein